MAQNQSLRPNQANNNPFPPVRPFVVHVTRITRERYSLSHVTAEQARQVVLGNLTREPGEEISVVVEVANGN